MDPEEQDFEPNEPYDEPPDDYTPPEEGDIPPPSFGDGSSPSSDPLSQPPISIIPNAGVPWDSGENTPGYENLPNFVSDATPAPPPSFNDGGQITLGEPNFGDPERGWRVQRDPSAMLNLLTPELRDNLTPDQQREYDNLENNWVGNTGRGGKMDMGDIGLGLRGGIERALNTRGRDGNYVFDENDLPPSMWARLPDGRRGVDWAEWQQDIKSNTAVKSNPELDKEGRQVKVDTYASGRQTSERRQADERMIETTAPSRTRLQDGKTVEAGTKLFYDPNTGAFFPRYEERTYGKQLPNFEKGKNEYKVVTDKGNKVEVIRTGPGPYDFVVYENGRQVSVPRGLTIDKAVADLKKKVGD